jgi:hypothetical protein
MLGHRESQVDFVRPDHACRDNVGETILFFGKARTGFQMALIATVVKLMRVAAVSGRASEGVV